MSSRGSILPSGEELRVSPEEVLRYIGPDALRQIFRQERLRWNMKPNKDADYYSNKPDFHKYSSDLHNEGLYQRMEIRTFPDHDAHAGYVGVNIDSGEFGPVHNIEKWNESIPDEAWEVKTGRMQIGASARIPDVIGNGIDDYGEMTRETINRQVEILFDPYTARAYLVSGDDPEYVNNRTRADRFPLRTLARIGDIPTAISDLDNDLDFVADPDYHHTDNNFTHTNRYVLDNLDDRTFVFPEVAKDRDGNFVVNPRTGLSGDQVYGESDGHHIFNSQPDYGEIDTGSADRRGARINSFNYGRGYSGVHHPTSYLPGIFRSIEELRKVDLVDQVRDPQTHRDSPAGRRRMNYYSFDGLWSPTWFDRYNYNDSYLAQSLHPTNMEMRLPDREPVPYGIASVDREIPTIYQWRYNRISVTWHSKDIEVAIVEIGERYNVGDILRWTFTDEVIKVRVAQVGVNGQLQRIEYLYHQPGRIFEQDPSTHGYGIPFVNFTGTGQGARISVFCPATISTHATQIKNNLYAFVDVVPSVRSNNNLPWSDTRGPDTQNGRINIRSSAAFPAHSGINSGRGGPIPNPNTDNITYHEHGGNATAGVQVHLFRYIINTQNPTFVIRNGIQIFTGRWVDQGPMGIERPCDIKALLFSNPDTNNFNNYYKFMVDAFFDSIRRNPDAVVTNNPNALSQLYIHKNQVDPEPNTRFTLELINPESGLIEPNVDITNRVLYINVATGVAFMFNEGHKNDPSFGYGNRPPGWFAVSGVVTR